MRICKQNDVIHLIDSFTEIESISKKIKSSEDVLLNLYVPEKISKKCGTHNKEINHSGASYCEIFKHVTNKTQNFPLGAQQPHESIWTQQDGDSLFGKA